jgi:hypothetical protein
MLSKKYVRTITRIPDDLWNEIKNIFPEAEYPIVREKFLLVKE